MAAAEKSATITCPRCGAQGTAPIWDRVDAQNARRDARHVLNETLFEVACNQCGNKLSLDYPLVYHDGDAKFLISYEPADSEPSSAAQLARLAREMKADAARDAALADKASPDQAELARAQVLEDPDATQSYRLRVVQNRNALREKVVVLRNGLDDRAVEVLKLTTFNLAASQGKLKGATGAFFGGVKKSGDVVIDFVGGKRHRETKVPADLYRSICADVQSYAPEGEGDRNVVVDSAWASDFLAQQS